MSTKPKSDPWYMAGTEGTGDYLVVARSKLGRVGLRNLGGTVRVRVEPKNKTGAKALAKAFPVGEWKQPDEFGQFRFSCVVPRAEVIKTVERAIKALGPDKLERNIKARFWRKPFKPAPVNAG